jgi:hypothetical protein
MQGTRKTVKNAGQQQITCTVDVRHCTGMVSPSNEFESRQVQENIPVSEKSRPALRLTQRSVQWVAGVLPPRATPSAEVKNE